MNNLEDLTHHELITLVRHWEQVLVRLLEKLEEQQ